MQLRRNSHDQQFIDDDPYGAYSERSGRQYGVNGEDEKTAAVRNDVTGVIIAVVAITMFISLVTVSDAPVTAAIGHVLRLGFGACAIVVPLVVFLWSLTFFIQERRLRNPRAVVGVVLILLGLMAGLSLAVPDITSETLMTEGNLIAGGGYVGASLAWVLLSFLGKTVGYVVIFGLAISGIIICGFTISGATHRIHDKARQRGEKKRMKQMVSSGFLDEDGLDSDYPFQGEDPELRDVKEGTAGFSLADENLLVDEDLADSDIPSRPGAKKTFKPNFFQKLFSGKKEGSAERTPLTSRFHAKDDVEPQTRLLQDLKGGEDGPERAAETSLLPDRATRILHRKPAGSGLDADLTQAAADYRFPSETDEVQPVDGGQPAGLSPQDGEAGDFQDSHSTPGQTRKFSSDPVASQGIFTHEDEDQDLQDLAVEPSWGFEEDGLLDEGEPEQEVEDEIPPFMQALSAHEVPEGGEAVAHQAAAAQGGAKGAASGASGLMAAAGQVKRPSEDGVTITPPPMSMLRRDPDKGQVSISQSELAQTGQLLQNTLAEFGLRAKVVGYAAGPLVTTFKIEMGNGERVSKITNLQDDIQLSLASESVRIYSPIPGTKYVGIEIPNKTRRNVYLGDVLPQAQGGPLEFAVGCDSEGDPVVANLSHMPHLLVAGTTGSGKSVMINSIIMSILMRATPEQVRLILVDPKRVEFTCYNGLPHLYVPVVTEPRQASSALQWAVTEMERRLKVFERAGARDIRVYNKMCVSGKLSQLEHPPTPMPYLVIVIDELSDLMMVAGKEVEASIVRIAQLARAAGIHLIVATQRPSADVVTGLIKSNIDTRIALKVSSSIDSRVILDAIGAERLLGHGDMLFRYQGNRLKRILGCHTSDQEIEEVVDFIRQQAEPDYHDEILSAVTPMRPGSSQGSSEDDPLLWEAAEIVVDTQLGSTSGLQRRLSVGYARAGRIMDMLEAKGVVGPPDGSKPRDVLLDKDQLAELREADEQYREV